MRKKSTNSLLLTEAIAEKFAKAEVGELRLLASTVLRQQAVGGKGQLLVLIKIRGWLTSQRVLKTRCA
jgi:hypothetical protein